MKKRPILFSTPMVRAILEGRKTQTRRVVKTRSWICDVNNGVPYEMTEDDSQPINCPFGQPGDRLWVRETWRRSDWPTGHPYEYRATAKEDGTPEDGPWKPSLFMPREASRIMLEITDIRVEQLLDISDTDAIAEGVESFRPVPGDGLPETRYRDYTAEAKFLKGHVVSKYGITTPRVSFLTLWESINGWKSLESNPWVWVVEFNPIQK